MLFQASGVVGLHQKIVDADFVEIGQPDQQLVGEGLGLGLHVAVFPLGDANGRRYLLLGQIMILPQVPDPVSHQSHLLSVIYGPMIS